MNKVNIAATGYPGTNKSWRFLHDAFAQPLLELAKACGDNTIISGCFVSSTNVVSPGWVAINGELFPFAGGKLTQGDNTPLYEKEEIEQAAYNTDLNDDNFFDNLNTYFTREITFAPTNTHVCNWGDMARIKTIKQLTQRVAFFDSIMSEDLMKKTPRPFTGTVEQIPAGFQLCNGENGTPNLLNKFVVGAGGEYEPGATGGAKEVTLSEAQMPKHKHAGNTAEAGAHSHSGSTNYSGSHNHGLPKPYHSANGTNSDNNRLSNSDNIGSDDVNSTNAGGAHSHTLNISQGGAHQHEFETNEKGNNQAHENRPPYYALCWIIWVGNN